MSKIEQVGGAHYQTGKAEQHWDRVWKLYGRGYFVGCATKYIERYHVKNGKEDLLKAISFIEKLIELEFPDALQVTGTTPGTWVPQAASNIKGGMGDKPYVEGVSQIQYGKKV